MRATLQINGTPLILLDDSCPSIFVTPVYIQEEPLQRVTVCPKEQQDLLQNKDLEQSEVLRLGHLDDCSSTVILEKPFVMQENSFSNACQDVPLQKSAISLQELQKTPPQKAASEEYTCLDLLEFYDQQKRKILMLENNQPLAETDLCLLNQLKLQDKVLSMTAMTLKGNLANLGEGDSLDLGFHQAEYELLKAKTKHQAANLAERADTIRILKQEIYHLTEFKESAMIANAENKNDKNVLINSLKSKNLEINQLKNEIKLLKVPTVVRIL